MTPSGNEPLVYSVVEAARALSTTEGAIRMMIQKQKLSVVHVGRRVLIPRESILDLLRSRIVR
jgi:excisionase family DNA binding protein